MRLGEVPVSRPRAIVRSQPRQRQGCPPDPRAPNLHFGIDVSTPSFPRGALFASDSPADARISVTWRRLIQSAPDASHYAYSALVRLRGSPRSDLRRSYMPPRRGELATRRAIRPVHVSALPLAFHQRAEDAAVFR
jgi:hypothetical protein